MGCCPSELSPGGTEPDPLPGAARFWLRAAWTERGPRLHVTVTGADGGWGRGCRPWSSLRPWRRHTRATPGISARDRAPPSTQHPRRDLLGPPHLPSPPQFWKSSPARQPGPQTPRNSPGRKRAAASRGSGQPGTLGEEVRCVFKIISSVSQITVAASVTGPHPDQHPQSCQLWCDTETDLSLSITRTVTMAMLLIVWVACPAPRGLGGASWPPVGGGTPTPIPQRRRRHGAAPGHTARGTRALPTGPNRVRGLRHPALHLPLAHVPDRWVLTREAGGDPSRISAPRARDAQGTGGNGTPEGSLGVGGQRAKGQGTVAFRNAAPSHRQTAPASQRE